MTTGRINQVRTIGGARARRAPPARVRAPTRARAPQGPASRRAPSRFVGRHAASARSRRLRMPGRVSPRLGGACLRPARGPSCPCGVAPTGARSPAPGLRRPQPRPGPGGFRRPGASPRASEERASGRAGGRAAHAGWPPRALARQPPACAVLAWPDRVPASFWFTRSERRRLHALPPCALRADPTRLPHTICSGTMRACENGRGGETSSPPKMGGEERGLLLLPSRFREGRSVGRAGRRARARARGRDWARHTCGREGRRNAPEPLIPIQAVII